MNASGLMIRTGRIRLLLGCSLLLMACGFLYLMRLGFRLKGAEHEGHLCLQQKDSVVAQLQVCMEYRKRVENSLDKEKVLWKECQDTILTQRNELKVNKERDEEKIKKLLQDYEDLKKEKKAVEEELVSHQDQLAQAKDKTKILQGQVEEYQKKVEELTENLKTESLQAEQIKAESESCRTILKDLQKKPAPSTTVKAPLSPSTVSSLAEGPSPKPTEPTPLEAADKLEKKKEEEEIEAKRKVDQDMEKEEKDGEKKVEQDVEKTVEQDVEKKVEQIGEKKAEQIGEKNAEQVEEKKAEQDAEKKATEGPLEEATSAEPTQQAPSTSKTPVAKDGEQPPQKVAVGPGGANDKAPQAGADDKASQDGAEDKASQDGVDDKSPLGEEEEPPKQEDMEGAGPLTRIDESFHGYGEQDEESKLEGGDANNEVSIRHQHL